MMIKKVASTKHNLKVFIDELNNQFKLGPIANGLRTLRFLGINTTQNEEFTNHTDANDELDSVQECTLCRSRK